MSQLLAIVGATGKQGGSVAHFVLSDRDATKPAAEALRARGAEVVTADLDNPESLKAALTGASFVFVATETVYDEKVKERELRQSKDVADAAVTAGVQYLIYSTEVHCEILSGGKYPVAAYDSKAEVEAYMRTLPIRSAFYAPATFMQNLATSMVPRPDPDRPGVYTIDNIFPGDCLYPWIDVIADAGKFVGAILADPDRFQGKMLWAGSELATMDEVAARISKGTGKTVEYVVVPEDTFCAHLPPAAQDQIANMFRFCSEYGYYGPESARHLEETITQVPYKLTTLDEYITAHVRLA
ncbi:hypothetical protein C7999DRAFT_44643 [Corynascus novoguineensis]|uniref:NmrA-like domain-containing protein n=1 Tax=Corynascus novoguineensis TaxID=1126955 RepID=A0AAN7HBD4_9PEZI|nr:hypothetical protein C7999DRAFT_44643 [Corynascus novoguineensis]